MQRDSVWYELISSSTIIVVQEFTCARRAKGAGYETLLGVVRAN